MAVAGPARPSHALGPRGCLLSCKPVDPAAASPPRVLGRYALYDAIAAGGVTVLEITMTVPGAIHVMRKLAETRPDILVGAGTVLDPETARHCILEGAQFIVSPAFNAAMVSTCWAASR